MPSKPSILVVGLPLDPSKHTSIKVPWADEPVNIIEELHALESKMRQRGYDEQHFTIGHVRPGHIAEDLKGYLQAHEWSGIMVGGGFRHFPQMTVGLEELVNAIKDHCPSSRILFMTAGPLSAIESVERFEQQMYGKNIA